MRQRSFTSQRLTLRYVERGDPSHPTVLLLHGGRDHARSWDGFAAAIEDRFHVVALDLRGHGSSDWVSDGSYDVLDHLVDVVALVDHLGVTSLFLAGHSLGGNIALRYAGFFPDTVQGLILIEALGPAPAQVELSGEPDSLDRMARWIASRGAVQHRSLRRYTTLKDAAARMQALNPSLPPATALHVARWGTRQNDDGSVSFSFDPAVIVAEALDLSWPDKHRLWNRIAAPVLLIYGADSWASSPADDGRQDHFSDALTVVIPAAGHWVHLDQPARFEQHAKAFLLEKSAHGLSQALR